MTAPCLEAGCRHLVRKGGRCPDHTRERERETHGRRHHEHPRIYHLLRWKMLRRRRLLANPICQDCGERLAEEVDHVQAIEDGGDAWDFDNTQGLCSSCHARKTAREVRRRRYGATTEQAKVPEGAGTPPRGRVRPGVGR